MTLGFLVMGMAGFFWSSLSDWIGAHPVVLMASVMLGLGLLLASRATSLVIFQLSYGVLIVGLGALVLDKACSQALAWLDSGFDFHCISVNMSLMQLWHPDFVHTVQRYCSVMA
ncbi:MAG: hypothetical protein MO846_00005 [Candidatus Devosia symbiotica]|nr:hypothetical protein [Candidatus Devosia symbiotica]